MSNMPLLLDTQQTLLTNSTKLWWNDFRLFWHREEEGEDVADPFHSGTISTFLGGRWTGVKALFIFWKGRMKKTEGPRIETDIYEKGLCKKSYWMLFSVSQTIHVVVESLVPKKIYPLRQGV
jgi:hypothetical protein